jgi:colicin import membrane protein
MTLIRSTVCSTLLAALLAACGTAPEVSTIAPPAPIASVAEADARLAAVAHERAAIEARYAAREQVCYGDFFVNHCLDQAKERRRSALAAQRAIEIDAEHYKRRAKVEERDRAMAQADAEYKAEEARLAAEPPVPAPQVTEAPPPRPGSMAERVMKHKEREQHVAAHEQADASKRAANVAAFEKRKAESEERQRMVAKRKADKAAKEAAKQKAKEPAPVTPGA